MKGVSKWEIAGIPATAAFYAAHRLGMFGSIPAESMPDVMLLGFMAVQAVRATGQWWLANKKLSSP